MQKRDWASYGAFLFFPLSIIFMECVVKAVSYASVLDQGFDYMVFFSLPVGIVLALLACWVPRPYGRILSHCLLGLIALWLSVQMVYIRMFRSVLVLNTMNMAGEALSNYWREALAGIAGCILPLVILWIPIILWGVFGAKLMPRQRWGLRPAALGVLAAVLLQLLAGFAVGCADEGIMSPRVLYRETFVPDLAAPNFGLLTTLRLDAKQLLSAGEKQVETVTETTTPATTAPSPVEVTTQAPAEVTTEAPIVWQDNILDIDFDRLRADETDPALLDMHEYFSTLEPTVQNEYTGMFAGKNLIFLTAEGFWRYAVDKTLTPTLYKLANEGFVFENFYNPLWFASTTDGEYAACTGLIPTAKYRAFNRSADKAMPFCMGHQLRAQGYETRAYHNHTYTYYDRHESHPNMGYDYYGLGNGLKVKKTWPESDLEMMEQTIPQALQGTLPFHNYYMTVSGHRDYFFNDNMMSMKHRDAVKAVYPDASEEFRAYKACQMELDLALEYLLTELETAGELENTVICLSADHYPYGMQAETWAELAGEEPDKDFEIYHSTLILWAGDMEKPVFIDKPCDSIDILPTLLNLFGLPYDSRLLMGRDILADEEGLVVFSNYSFITEQGRYNARKDTFTPNEGAEVPDTYALDIYHRVRDMFDYSEKIISKDYYAVLGLTPEETAEETE